MKKIRIIMLLVFCVMLTGGALATWLVPDREYSALENRELAQSPEFSGREFLKGEYQTAYESYLNDQFPMRDRWVDVAVRLQSAAGRKDINDVYLGTEGYLLEKNEEKDCDSGQVEENIETLSSFLNDMTQTYGDKHVSCLMIPSKTLALSNRLPAFAKLPERKEVINSLKEKLSHPNELMDLREPLQKHQNEYIYYRTDHHWTTLGAYYAYQTWAEKRGQATPRPLKYYPQETIFTDFYGTTYNKVHLPVPADEVTLFHSPAEKGIEVSRDDGDEEADTLYFPKETSNIGCNRYDVFLSGNTFKIEINTKAKTGRTLLLVKDSFANCFVPFLTEDYDRIIMIDYRYGKIPMGTILSEYSDITDVLVMFNTDKFMENTKLGKLAQTEKKEQTMQAFDPEEFLG